MAGPIQQSFEEIDWTLLKEIEESELYFDTPNEFEDCILNAEELKVFLTPPAADEWKDFSSNENATIFNIDDAKERQWQMGKVEIEHLRNKLKTTFGIDYQSLSLEDLASSIIFTTLGPESKFGSFFAEELSLSKMEYAAFMCTLFTQAAYRVSVTELYLPQSRLKVPMEEEDYLKMWENMAKKKKIPEFEMRTPMSPIPLWKGVEEIVNTLLRTVSIIDRREIISISLDDDKVWFGSTKARTTDQFDIKFTTHVKPNRKGIVVHTAVTTGVMVPVAATVQQTNDDSVSCFERIFNFLFGSGGKLDLRSVEVQSDRGYMLPNLVFDLILRHGGNLVGTCKRIANCWPFTHNQNLADNDTRTLIETKGAPSLFLKYFSVDRGEKTIFASSFRNGSGAVATALSTLHGNHQWEGIALKPSERISYKKDSTCFASKFLVGIDIDDGVNKFTDDDIEISLRNDIMNRIKPFTLRQGTADWFWQRKFSLTSSQAHGAFLKLLPDKKDNEDWIKVATYLYGEDWTEVLGLGAQEQDSSDTTTTNDDLKSFLQEYDVGSSECKKCAVSFLREYVENEIILSKENASTIWTGINFENVNRAEVKRDIKAILVEFNPEMLGMKNANDTLMQEWLSSCNSKREILFYKNQSLREIMKRRHLKKRQGVSNLNVSDMIDGISGSDRTKIVEDVSLERDAEALSNREKAVLEVLKKSFMPHQKGKDREYCQIGHRLELPILKKFVELIPGVREYSNVKVKNAYTVGLAAKKDAVYAKDSIDFLLSVEENNMRSIWGFECKGRVTHSTEVEERQNFTLNQNPHLRIQSKDVFEMIQRVSERFQVLQHVFVYDLDTVVHAIGNLNASLIRTCIIDFDDDIKDSFGAVLDDIKHETLEWAYPTVLTGRNEVLPIPDEIVDIAVKFIPEINDEETLQGAVNLWHVLRQQVLPMPSFRRLIPAVCTYWNATKGGSDTITKLMDSCILRIPKAWMNNETVAITRLVQLLTTLNHRLLQCGTGSENLNYPSLLHWRHAASERTSYHTTLLFHVTAFQKYIDECKTSEVMPMTRVEPPRRTDRRARVDGILPEKIDFAPTAPNICTPPRLASMLESGNAPTEYKTMARRCMGSIVQAYPPKANKSCALCKKSTGYFCTGCKRWFCFAKQKKNVKNLYSHTVQGTEMSFIKTCFHTAHEDCWNEYYTESIREDEVPCVSPS
ncbi:hypothetical protein CTEN210_09822 [Chaetoceros tenuissimus]|uniref:Uncharacterized protein n=1 Tax=Chaetoceros tenuissimus TaxID=426638 RepID=A0AAD3CY84_9STRA|nr:hypothetical protein CTEN210_03676 [Chaetoceros tenuissimus]GFH53346.1 hypothetical protein CTEN210_09822 [Chaetoceros tenuissimus]